MENITDFSRVIMIPANEAPYCEANGAQLIAVKLDETGYWPVSSTASADVFNGAPLPVDVRESALCASMFGWHVPLARKAREWIANKQTPDAFAPGAKSFD